MYLTDDPFSMPEGERNMALDWAAIGGAVRRRAMLAVAVHFAEVAELCEGAGAGWESDRELSLGGS